MSSVITYLNCNPVQLTTDNTSYKLTLQITRMKLNKIHKNGHTSLAINYPLESNQLILFYNQKCEKTHQSFKKFKQVFEQKVYNLATPGTIESIRWRVNENSVILTFLDDAEKKDFVEGGSHISVYKRKVRFSEMIRSH